MAQSLSRIAVFGFVLVSLAVGPVLGAAPYTYSVHSCVQACGSKEQINLFKDIWSYGLSLADAEADLAAQCALMKKQLLGKPMCWDEKKDFSGDELYANCVNSVAFRHKCTVQVNGFGENDTAARMFQGTAMSSFDDAEKKGLAHCRAAVGPLGLCRVFYYYASEVVR